MYEKVTNAILNFKGEGKSNDSWEDRLIKPQTNGNNIVNFRFYG